MSQKISSLRAPQLPDYVFLERLGQGTYGTVYKALRKEGSRRETVAVKCILKSGLSKAASDNTVTEITILKRIRHEHIVEMKDFRWDEIFIYVIFEYCSRGDLSQFIKRNKRLPESLVKHFLQQLATALKVLRDNQVAHLDLKPHNILLASKERQESPTTCPSVGSNTCRDITLKVADFGFSQFLSNEEAGTSLRGSLLYMAPEILLKHKYDARVDLWSVGIILYECLFGQAPFSCNSFEDLAGQIKSNEPIRIPNTIRVSSSCQNLLAKLLQRDPEKRINFEQFFSHPFLDLEHMPSSASYEKGVQLIQKAVEKDKAANFQEAFDLYTESLQYLVPVFTWGAGPVSDKSRRDNFRTKLVGYISRAEELKKKGNISNLSSEEEIALHKAYEDAFDGDSLADQEFPEEALSKYKTALEVLVPMVNKFEGKDKAILYEEVNEWVTRAEEVKKSIKTQEIDQKKKGKRRFVTLKERNKRQPTQAVPNLNETIAVPTCYIQ